jgi:hypothetical protein
VRSQIWLWCRPVGAAQRVASARFHPSTGSARSRSVVAMPVPRRPGGADSCEYALQLTEAYFCRTMLLGLTLYEREGGLAR